jgi:hypothetical protein
MRNLTILFSNKLQKCWLCRHTFMANSPIEAIGDNVAQPAGGIQPGVREDILGGT